MRCVRILISVIRSEKATAGEPDNSRRKEGGKKKSAHIAEGASMVEPMQSKKQELKQGRFDNLVSESCAVGYESSRYLGTFAAQYAVKRNSRLPKTLQADDFLFCKFFLVALFSSALTP